MSVMIPMSDEQFAVIYAFLYRTKLGDANKFEAAISDFMIDVEKADIYNQVLDSLGEEPKIEVLCSDENGLEFHVI